MTCTFLRWELRDGSIVNNHLKYLVNEFPITMLMVGTDLTELGLFRTGRSIRRRRYWGQPRGGPQASNWSPISMTTEGMALDRASDRTQSGLARHKDGTLTHQLSDYLFDRSTGYMGSLMT